MANGNKQIGGGLFGVPSRDQLLQLRRRQAEQRFQERIASQAQFLPPNERNVFAAFANLGRQAGQAIPGIEGPDLISEGEDRRLAALAAGRQRVEQLQQSGEFKGLGAAEQNERMLGEMARAAIQEGDLQLGRTLLERSAKLKQERLLNAAQTAEAAASARPEAPEPEAVTLIKRGTNQVMPGIKIRGQLFDSQGNPAPEGFVLFDEALMPDEEEPDAFQDVTLINTKTGEKRRGGFNPKTNKTRFEDGSPVPKGWIPFDAQMTGDPSSFDQLGQTEGRRFRDRKVSAKQMIETTKDAVDLLSQSPDYNTFVASASGLVNELRAEAAAVGRFFGDENPDETLDPSSYEDTFAELGFQQKRLKSMLVSLAYQTASVHKQGDRVNKHDVERFLEQVGQKTANPKTLAARLTDLARRAVRRVQLDFRARTGEELGDDFGLSTFPQSLLEATDRGGVFEGTNTEITGSVLDDPELNAAVDEVLNENGNQ